MRRFKRAAIAGLLLSVIPAFSTSAWAQACACAGAAAGVTIRAEDAPPPLPDYDQPPLPTAGVLWTPGYWAWNNYEYYWVPGTWVEPPRPGLLWTPGYWAFADGLYGFHPGYWGPHVGFYGGVPYGFGYGGAGYEGARWNGDRLFYNRVVNNFGPIHIENVYEKPAAERPGAASFNGPGGATASATAQEEEFAHEPHERPTAGQIEHARTASMTTELFVSTNRGKPSIAATAAPGAFKGAGVVRAKSAGAPIRRVNETAPGAGPTPMATPTPEPRRTPEVKQQRTPLVEPAPRRTPAAEPTPGVKTPELEKEQRLPHEVDKRVLPTPAPDRMPNVGQPKPSPMLAPGGAREREPLQPAHALERNGEPGAGHGPEKKEKCGEPNEPKCL